jgi:hypothetical protein
MDGRLTYFGGPVLLRQLYGHVALRDQLKVTFGPEAPLVRIDDFIREQTLAALAVPDQHLYRVEQYF